MKLNDTQLIVLSNASARENRAVMPIPKTLKLNNAESIELMQGLLRKKLIAEWPAVVHEPVWREKNGKPFTLVITDKGLQAINAMPEEAEPAEKTPAKAKPGKPQPVKTSPTKSAIKKPDIVLTLLSRSKGATMEQLQEATGWQAHSIRAVISGLRKKDIHIARSQAKDGTTIYRVEKA